MRNKHYYGVLLASCLAIGGCSTAGADITVNSNDLSPTTTANASLPLNGEWLLAIDPAPGFFASNFDDSSWTRVRVPGEPILQGVEIERGNPFAYRKRFLVPESHAGHRSILQFDGVYSDAIVWVDGVQVARHRGGFTRWEVDITDLVNPGSESVLAIEVVDRMSDISYASGYAQHPIGGILRDVTLLARPLLAIDDVFITTDFDGQYLHADLKVDLTLSNIGAADASSVRFTLLDPDGQTEVFSQGLSLNSNRLEAIFPVVAPSHWTAETPTLYTLKIDLIDGSRTLQTVTKRVGFREIELESNRLLVNGQPVKLRGVNRHDIDPRMGRSSSPENDWRDVTLAKQANINFIRTSHYPPTQKFVEACDEQGIYLQVESAVSFVGTWRKDPFKAPEVLADEDQSQYLSQVQEMFSTFKNNPSVIVWSIGNESIYNAGFEESYEWLEKADSTREIMFSYPGTLPEGKDPVWGLISSHYPDKEGDRFEFGMRVTDYQHPDFPVVFDEWLHVAAYDYEALEMDPFVRDFWGMGLDYNWERVLERDGAVGGAIWGYIDEVFFLPDGHPGQSVTWGLKTDIPERFVNYTAGYGPWGLLDVWRRPKPEYWNTKKAYSPVRLLQTDLIGMHVASGVSLPVRNRFDHTNLRDLTIRVDGVEIPAPDVAPHKTGQLNVPATVVTGKESAVIEFFLGERQIDVERLTLRDSQDETQDDWTPQTMAPVSVSQTEDVFKIVSGDMRLQFGRENGRLKLWKKDELLVSNGPLINVRYRTTETTRFAYYKVKQLDEEWQLKAIDVREMGDRVRVEVKGSYLNGSVEFVYEIAPGGRLTVDYAVRDAIPVTELVQETDSETLGFLGTSAAVTRDLVREIGIFFEAPTSFNNMAVKKKSYWSYYPEGHIGRQNAQFDLWAASPSPVKFRAPTVTWEEDTRDLFIHASDSFAYKSKLISRARATQDNISSVVLSLPSGQSLKVKGDSKQNLRLANPSEGKLQIFFNKETDFPNLGWGNVQQDIPLESGFADRIRIR